MAKKRLTWNIDINGQSHNGGGYGKKYGQDKMSQKDKARTFGQDLMKGENGNFKQNSGGASA